jgi:Tol biopolymer transport system component
VFHNAINPAMSAASQFARGPFVVYQANSDIMGNGSSGFEIFRFRLFRYEQNQYTFSTAGESQHPVVSDGGGYIVFQSTADLIDPERSIKGGGTPPFNADGNSEIYRTKGRRRIWQITESQGCQNTLPSVQDTGQGIAFISTCDLIPGNNPNHVQQVFFYQETPRLDPRILPQNCKVAEGCCSVLNDCYQMRLGRQVRVK